MHTSATLSRYIGRQFLTYFALLWLTLLAIVLLLDFVELLRRGGSKPDITVWLIFKMALLKLPDIGQQIIPFVILFSAMFTFWRLTRSHELVVARAVGVSAWQFLMPVLVAAVIIGVAKVALINPIGAVFLARFDHLEERYLKQRSNAFAVSRTGLWLRQTGEDEELFIHAEAVKPETLQLSEVVVFRFTPAGEYVARIDAGQAQLRHGRWELRDAIQHRGERAEILPQGYSIATELDMQTIEESFAPPETISFWALPRFIRTLEATGFPAVRHRIHFQAQLSQPLLFCAMVLFAAVFSLRLPRRGGTLIMITGGVLTGFVIFVMSDVIRTFGMSETIPVTMAAWSPAGVAILLGAAALLHLEDG